jgi:hypothetical protein
MANRKEGTASNMQQSINTINQAVKGFMDAMNQTTMALASNLK